MQQISLDDIKAFLQQKVGVEWKGEVMLANQTFTFARSAEQILNQPISFKVFKGENFGWFTFIINENQFKSVFICTKNGQEFLVDGIDFSSKWRDFITQESTKKA